jgi:hypothetical protein
MSIIRQSHMLTFENFMLKVDILSTFASVCVFEFYSILHRFEGLHLMSLSTYTE